MEEGPFNSESEFSNWLEQQKYPEHFKHAKLLLVTAEDALEKKVEAPSDSAYAKAIALIFGRAYKSYFSAVRLGVAALTEDMGVIVRSLLNLYIIGLWISKSHREARARRYLAWYWIEMHRLLSLIPAPPDAGDEIEREYRKYKGLFEYRDSRGKLRMLDQWHDSNVKQMATAVGLTQHYNAVYKPLSATEHSSALSYFGMLSGSDQSVGTTIALRDHKFVPFYLGYGYQYLAGVLFLWNKQFGALDSAALDEQIRKALNFFTQEPLGKSRNGPAHEDDD